VYFCQVTWLRLINRAGHLSRLSEIGQITLAFEKKFSSYYVILRFSYFELAQYLYIGSRSPTSRSRLSRIRNPWVALFEWTNHNTRMCNMILLLVLWLVNSNNASQGFRTLRLSTKLTNNCETRVVLGSKWMFNPLLPVSSDYSFIIFINIPCGFGWRKVHENLNEGVLGNF